MATASASATSGGCGARASEKKFWTARCTWVFEALPLPVTDCLTRLAGKLTTGMLARRAAKQITPRA